MCRKHSGKRNRCHGYVFREVFGVIVFSFTVGVAQNLLDMFTKPKLLAVGASVGILLPKEMLVRMKITKGDTLFAVEMPEGYLLAPYDPTVERQLSKGQSIHGQLPRHFPCPGEVRRPRSASLLQSFQLLIGGLALDTGAGYLAWGYTRSNNIHSSAMITNTSTLPSGPTEPPVNHAGP